MIKSKKLWLGILIAITFAFIVLLAIQFKLTFLPLIFVIVTFIVFSFKPTRITSLLIGIAFAFFLKSLWPFFIGIIFAFFGKPKRWWPIPAGIAFALVELLSFYLSERPLGITRGYTVTGAIVEYLFVPAHAESISYWERYYWNIDWTMALILGIILGSYVSSRSSGDFRFNAVPETWKLSRGTSVTKRWIWAFVAGIMMGFAARIAGGCVSGLLISASIQLAPGGFIFMFSLWIGGVATTLLFYRTRAITLKRE